MPHPAGDCPSLEASIGSTSTRPLTQSLSDKGETAILQVHVFAGLAAEKAARAAHQEAYDQSFAAAYEDAHRWFAAHPADAIEAAAAGVAVYVAERDAEEAAKEAYKQAYQDAMGGMS
jgi:ABC-type nitrate/sulfonate/bicarbonate transport system substrate-binding protein